MTVFGDVGFATVVVCGLVGRALHVPLPMADIVAVEFWQMVWSMPDGLYTTQPCILPAVHTGIYRGLMSKYTAVKLFGRHCICVPALVKLFKTLRYILGRQDKFESPTSVKEFNESPNTGKLVIARLKLQSKVCKPFGSGGNVAIGLLPHSNVISEPGKVGRLVSRFEPASKVTKEEGNAGREDI
jgi:hypothetical protein